MVESYYTTNRKVTKNRLLQFIQEHPDNDMKKILGLFSLQTGLRVSTLKTYLEELKDAGLID